MRSANCCLAASIASDPARAQNCAQDVNCPPDWSQPEVVTLKLELEWKPIGRVIERGGRLVFPPVAKKAGDLPFRVQARWLPRTAMSANQATCERRFRQICCSGATQDTNNRLRRRMLLTLRAPGEVSGRRLHRRGPNFVTRLVARTQQIPVTSQRRLLERAGILHGASEQGVELLNYDLPKSIRPAD